MSSFTEPLIVKIEQRDKRPFEVAAPFTYLVGMDAGREITVREGFITDGATVPRPLTAFISPIGRHGKAAILHDWLYRWPEWDDVWRKMVPEARNPRHAADMILMEAMAVLHVPLRRRLAIYAAVRAFGWIAWMRLRKNDEMAQQA
jgi:hypothetical protein